MTDVVNNLIAFRILYMLVTPFEKTEAFKLGVIDTEGTPLLKIKDMTSDQKDAYTMLHRLVFSLKRLLAKIPGGKSQIATIAAAYYLVKEAYENKSSINEDEFHRIIDLTESGIIFVEEQILVEKFLKLCEDVAAGGTAPIANVTGSAVATDIPVIKPSKKKIASSIIRRAKPINIA